MTPKNNRALSAAAKMIAKGHTYREAATTHGVSIANLHRFCALRRIASKNGPHRRRGTGAKPETLKAANLVKRGFTYREACQIAGASVSAVYQFMAVRAENPKRKPGRFTQEKAA
ncbi:hypothetical protein UFOVP399_62 [uncultured Caudovirales phage]|uniref:Uncharacterized protein n=1 Tax=uncultured Caudovirales phage TaxID=2100421 RepID=A0A6J5M686_9CAUD|nr:hypothetical protein UFOVP399_62 [uncultured Caudovirales phage]